MFRQHGLPEKHNFSQILYAVYTNILPVLDRRHREGERGYKLVLYADDQKVFELALYTDDSGS